MAPSILSIRMRTGMPIASTVSCRKRTSLWMIKGVQPAPGWVNSADGHGPRRSDAAGRVNSGTDQDERALEGPIPSSSLKPVAKLAKKERGRSEEHTSE